ncbi:MAG: hypothetical protein ABR574_11780 [Cryomorphaceae bacterium]
MAAITSELYVRSSSVVDEKICIGLFVINDDNVFFDYSKKKLSISLKLVESLDKSTIVHWLESLKEKISRDHRSDELGYFRSDFNSATLDYLNTYSNGVFYFSKPKPIATKVSEQSFKVLFRKLVDSEMGVAKEFGTPNFKREVRAILKTAPFKRIDTSYKVLPDLVSGIYAPHKIDLIGKNGSLLVGDSIDFNAPPASIDKSLFEFDRIARGLKKLSIERGLDDKGKYYAYFSPPEGEEGKKVLSLALKDRNKSFVLKELDHLEKLGKKIVDGKYKKFSEWLNE